MLTTTLICNTGKEPKRNQIIWLAACAVLCAILTIGSIGTAFSAQCKDPDVIKLSIIPTEETIQELTLYQPVINYMKKLTGKKIEFYMPTSYASVVQAMVNDFVDVAVLGPYSYVIAHKKDPNIVVFATYSKAKGHLEKGGPHYLSDLITKKGTKFTTIESLKGSVLALVDPASTSGNLVPRALFAQEVLHEPLEKYFSKVVYTGGHDLSTMALYHGKVDAAFVATHRFDDVVDRGLVKASDFNVLWKSPEIPEDPFVYQDYLCPKLKKAIAKTFLTVDTQPKAAKFLQNVHAVKFVPMQDSDYDIIRQIHAKLQ